MRKLKIDNKKEKKQWIKILKNKTFITWCKYNSIILILGSSLILNIIYLPKILNGTINQNNNVTTSIEINAINGTKTILPKTTYITTFNSLGNLLTSCPNNIFKIEKTQYGRLLVGINGLVATANQFWQIEYWTGEKFVPSAVGIDDIKLKNNEIFQFDLIQFDWYKLKY